MHQRISVRAIIRQDNQTLLLRRASGRQSILGQYELPGGRLAYREQPEDALRRYLHDDTGLHMQTAKLFDAVTYIDQDDRDIQYAVLVYVVTLADGHHPLELSRNYDKSIWESTAHLQHESVRLTDLSQLLLGIIEQEQLAEAAIEKLTQTATAKTPRDDSRVTIYSDGGSRGNPGPSAAGFVMIDAAQQVIDQGGEYLGITTNNQAEYHGVRLGLERALARGYVRADFRIDSMLVVNQLNGVYRIKNRELWPIHERIRELMGRFEQVKFSHVKREFNQLADGVVNRTLDAHANEQ